MEHAVGTAIVTKNDYLGEDEVFCDWYQCPHCKNEYIANGDNFCSNCGIALRWAIGGGSLGGSKDDA